MRSSNTISNRPLLEVRRKDFVRFANICVLDWHPAVVAKGCSWPIVAVKETLNITESNIRFLPESGRSAFTEKYWTTAFGR